MGFVKSLLRPENRFGTIGGVILLIMLLASIFAPLIAPYDPFVRSGAPFESPSMLHLLGTNDVGNDILSELIYGGRISLSITLFAAFYSTLVATVIALIAGYMGGKVDKFLMRVVDIMMSLPFLPLVIVLGVFLGSGMGTRILVITLVMWANPCRELRSQVLKTRSNGYVDASRAMGEKTYKIILRHTLHDLKPLIVPQFVYVAYNALLLESSLSFLGLGDPLSKSWGSMLFFANARAAFLTGAWVYWIAPPGLCIALACLSFTLIGFTLSGKRGFSYLPYGIFKHNNVNTANYWVNPGTQPLMLSDLCVKYGTDECLAVSHVNFEINPREVVGLVGESGCGKTTMAMAVLSLLRSPAETTGDVFIKGENIFAASGLKILKLRGKTIAYVPQNAMNTLNPVMSVQEQLGEAIRVHRKLSKKEEMEEVERLLDFVDIGKERKNSYNHELSGGMKQRVVIAMALANEPDILVADEPTTGLDVLVQRSVLDLVMGLKDKMDLSILLITHDLPLAMAYSDRMAVMYQGEIVEMETVDEIRSNPKHFYTQKLFSSFPSLVQNKAWQRNGKDKDEEHVLTIRGLSKTFHSKATLFRRRPAPVKAVDNVSFTVRKGEVLGLIGGSGSGKTTISRLIIGLETADSGEIILDGQDIQNLRGAKRRLLARNIHIVFQDPYQSMRNSMTVYDIVAEPMKIHCKCSHSEMKARICEALEDVHLPHDDQFLKRVPAQLSGGQRQRLSFARAIVARPEFIIADEPTSMLDVSLRKELLKLMEELRGRHKIGYIFITHDISLAYHFCDRIMVMKDGSIIENAEAGELVANPGNEYTRQLISAVEL